MNLAANAEVGLCASLTAVTTAFGRVGAEPGPVTTVNGGARPLI